MGIRIIRIEQKSTVRIINDMKVKIMFWDSDSNRTHERIRSVYYAKANGILLVYNIANKDSFHSLEFWINSIIKAIKDSSWFKHQIIYLVGTKTDLLASRVILSCRKYLLRMHANLLRNMG